MHAHTFDEVQHSVCQMRSQPIPRLATLRYTKHFEKMMCKRVRFLLRRVKDSRNLQIRISRVLEMIQHQVEDVTPVHQSITRVLRYGRNTRYLTNLRAPRELRVILALEGDLLVTVYRYMNSWIEQERLQRGEES